MMQAIVIMVWVKLMIIINIAHCTHYNNSKGLLYVVGDYIYVMHNNNIREQKIVGIRIGDISIKYILSSIPDVDQGFVFKTKQELLDSL